MIPVSHPHARGRTRVDCLGVAVRWGTDRAGKPPLTRRTARDAATNFLRTPMEMRALIEAARFHARAWDDVTVETSGASAPYAVHSIQSLVMADMLATITHNGRRNRDEGRLVMVQAVFDRP